MGKIRIAQPRFLFSYILFSIKNEIDMCVYKQRSKFVDKQKTTNAYRYCETQSYTYIECIRMSVGLNLFICFIY